MIDPMQGERLQHILKSYNLSDYQFAEIIGFDRSYINAIVHGRRKLTGNVLKAIQANFPMVEIEWLKGNPNYKFAFKSERIVNRIASSAELYTGLCELLEKQGYTVYPCSKSNEIEEFPIVEDFKFWFTFHHAPRDKYLIVAPNGDNKTISFNALLSMLRMIERFTNFVVTEELFKQDNALTK